MKKERVLIVGGGFGGVKAALELEADERFEVTLL
jgi:NADH dehydrogenase FAD-containing subunit